jgi:hypothetical protein
MNIDFSSEQQFGMLIGLIAVSGGLLIGLAGVVGGFVVSLRRLQIESDLKLEMLQRGMSADDIKMVLESSTPNSRLGGCSSRRLQREGNSLRG